MTRSGWIAPPPRSRVHGPPPGSGIGRPGVRGPRSGRRLAGLPELVVEGLREADARALLASVLTGPLDSRVADRIVAEAGGNPLALVELPRGMAPAELAGGFALPAAMPPSGRMEESFRRRLEVLPADTRRLLQLAAAEPVGDPVLMWRRRATRHRRPGRDIRGRGRPDEIGARVLFRHPLVRSAAYGQSHSRSATGASCPGRGNEP